MKVTVERAELLKSLGHVHRVVERRNTIPILANVIAFQYYEPYLGSNFFDSIAQSAWTGLENFERMMTDRNFWNAVENTLVFSFLQLTLFFPIPILLALLINQIASPRLKGLTQTITYMPHFISIVVMVSIIQIFLTPGSGALGRILGEDNLMGDPGAFVHIYWISEIWQHTGWNCIIYLAALSAVDLSLYEAATGVQPFRGEGLIQIARRHLEHDPRALRRARCRVPSVPTLS